MDIINGDTRKKGGESGCSSYGTGVTIRISIKVKNTALFQITYMHVHWPQQWIHGIS